MTGKGGWEDRSDVRCPARPSAQELWELSSRRGDVFGDRAEPVIWYIYFGRVVVIASRSVSQLSA